MPLTPDGVIVRNLPVSLARRMVLRSSWDTLETIESSAESNFFLFSDLIVFLASLRVSRWSADLKGTFPVIASQRYALQRELAS